MSQNAEGSSRWPNRHLDTRCMKFIEAEPNPEDYGILEITTKSDGSVEKVKINKKGIIRWLRARRIVFENQTPYIFDGMIYRRCSAGDISRLIYALSEFWPECPFLTKAAVADLYEMLKETTKTEILPKQAPDGWQSNLYEGETIAFANVLYNLDLDDTVPFVPWIFKKTQLRATFDPTVENDPCEAVYEKILPDKKTRDFFFQAVGYSIFSEKLSPPAIFVVYGPAETGKSALQKAIEAAVGSEYISTLDLAQISGNFTTAELENKLINICGETGSGQNREYSKADGELIKRLSDGQAVTMQRKYGQPFQANNTAKLWFISNTPPDFGDSSSGIYRRLYIIPCRNKQRWEDQIYDKLTTQTAVSWLMNKAIEGYREFLDNGRKFKVSPEMTDESISFKTQDGLMDFIEEMCGTLDKEAICDTLNGKGISDIYDLYRIFINESGGKPLSRRKMSEKIRNEFSLKNEKKAIQNDEGRMTHKSFFRKTEPKKEEPKKEEPKTGWTVNDLSDFREKHGLRNGMIVPSGADKELVKIFKERFIIVEKDGDDIWWGGP